MKLSALLSRGCAGAQLLKSGNFGFAVMWPSFPGEPGGAGGCARDPLLGGDRQGWGQGWGQGQGQDQGQG